MHAIRTWWGQRFIAALEQFTDPSRLARGRSYANEYRIKSWTLEKGAVTAKIRGNVNPYYGVHKEPTYDTRIALKPIPAADWGVVIRYLGSRAAFVARLLLDQMPDNIEKPFAALELNLLPKSAKDLQTRCSCPDYANPCKHVAGLCYFLAAQLDRDPFLLFELRGLAREDLFKHLRGTPLGKALAAREHEGQASAVVAESYFTRPQPREPWALADPLDFWRGGKRLPEPLDADPTPPLVSALLVKKGGAYPEFWQEATSLPDILEQVYAVIRKRSKEW